jgi:hypothetical protein
LANGIALTSGFQHNTVSPPHACSAIQFTEHSGLLGGIGVERQHKLGGV